MVESAREAVQKYWAHPRVQNSSEFMAEVQMRGPEGGERVV